MKTATFGLSTYDCAGISYLVLFAGRRLSKRRTLDARVSYARARLNGGVCDMPSKTIPADGVYSWGKDGHDTFRVKYTEGPGDREWMEQCDRNYLARLGAEKQSAARKQEREAQLPDNQEKLKREQQLKKEADVQLKPVSVGENIPAGCQVHSQAQTAARADTDYPLYTPQAGSSSASTGGYSLDSPSLRPSPPISATAPIAGVLYPLQGASTEELTLPAGAKVRVVDRVSPDWRRCEHGGQAGLVPSQHPRALSSAQVPSAPPAGYTGYTTPTSGEALGTAGIFTATTPNSAVNQPGTPGAIGDFQMYPKS
jgi:SH3 domain